VLCLSKSGPKPSQPPAPLVDSNQQVAEVEGPPVPPKPQTAPKPKKAAKPNVIQVTEDLPPPPASLLAAPVPQVKQFERSTFFERSFGYTHM
jgi:hypothetical protein